MIHDVDQLLEEIVRRDALNGSAVELVFDAPTKDWVARRSGPAVDLYLYDIREDLERRVPAWEDVKDGSGQVKDRRLPPRRFRLAYLVTAWTQRPEDEHRLLSALLSCFIRNAMLKPDDLDGHPGRAEPADLHRRRPAADAGPLAGGRLVGARRRAQAVARRHRDRADRRLPQRPVRSAGPAGADAGARLDRRRGGDRRRRPAEREARRWAAGAAARGDRAARLPTTSRASSLRVRGLRTR